MFSHEFVEQAAAEEQAGKKTRMRVSTVAAVQTHFSAVPLFEECSKRELRLLAKIAVIEPRAAGATLITEGQCGSDAYVILRGKCRVMRKGRRVGAITVGSIVGELSMLNGAERNATVVADSALEVAIIARRDFLSLLRHSPSISRKLLTSLAARVQELDARAPA